MNMNMNTIILMYVSIGRSELSCFSRTIVLEKKNKRENI